MTLNEQMNHVLDDLALEQERAFVDALLATFGDEETTEIVIPVIDPHLGEDEHAMQTRAYRDWGYTHTPAPITRALPDWCYPSSPDAYAAIRRWRK